MMKIVVTGAGAVLGQGIIKSLRASSLPCEILALDPNPLSSGLYWADKARLIPMASEPDYIKCVEQILAEERPDAVLVGTDVELAIFAEHRHEWETKFATHIIISDPRMIAIADDKYLTCQFLADHDLDPPLSALPENDEELAHLIETAGFPLIVKPRVGARSVGVSLVHNPAQLADALKGRTGLMVQQWAGPDDEEYTSSVLFFDDRPQASIVMRRDLRDGNTYRAYADEYPELNDFIRKVACALRPYGPANFQFRRDLQGKPHIFEINARFSGATPLRALVGFNEVEMCLRKILYGTEISQPPIKSGIILRHLDEQFVSREQVALAG
ncbi:MAG: ATP-grasp domain-containing protein [Sphingorhabdus sp.]